MKNNQAAGTELLYSESFKYGGNEIKNWLKLWPKCERGGGRQSRWKKGIICVLCGKGEKMDCTDYMGVNLYIGAYWTLSKVLYNRHWVFVEIKTGKHQRGLH
jgi:hypothetical protein